MTRERVEAWLGARRPERPAQLAAQMSGAVDGCDAPALEAATTMTEAMGLLGIAALKRATARTSESQALAMELLAADAFVTYAFEAAAEEGVSVQPLVSRLVSEAV